MENATYIALSRQMAAQRQLDIIANNLANMNTAGFKAERPLFHEHVMRAGARDRLSFMRDDGITRDMRAGGQQTTGNSLDVAIDGPGYFAVSTPAGIRYTRNGQWRVGADGQIVTNNGHALADERGQAIRLDDPGAGPPVIGPDGSIGTEGGEVIGRVNLVDFPNPQALRHDGEGLYSTDQAPTTGIARLRQSMIENSNVNPIAEVSAMIALQRSYQATQRLIDNDHDRQRKAIERLARAA
jgi:flagellar basal-body rod protein FlgF